MSAVIAPLVFIQAKSPPQVALRRGRNGIGERLLSGARQPPRQRIIDEAAGGQGQLGSRGDGWLDARRDEERLHHGSRFFRVDDNRDRMPLGHKVG